MTLKIGRIHLFLVTALLTLSSCKKDRQVWEYDGEYELSGQVLDLSSGEPVPFARVGVYQGDGHPYMAVALAEVQADKEGRYKMKFPVDTDMYYYELMATAAGFYSHGAPGSSRIKFTKSGKGKQQISLMPGVFLTLLIKGNTGRYQMNAEYVRHTFFRGVDTSVTVNLYPHDTISFTYYVKSKQGNPLLSETMLLKRPAVRDTMYQLIEF